jgi:hypothetical protein
MNPLLNYFKILSLLSGEDIPVVTATPGTPTAPTAAGDTTPQVRIAPAHLGRQKGPQPLKLGTRPRSFISGSVCFAFLVQCLCIVHKGAYNTAQCAGASKVKKW